MPDARVVVPPERCDHGSSPKQDFPPPENQRLERHSMDEPVCNNNHSANGDSKENRDPIFIDDISSFLDTMHAKNMILKKIVKTQQERIDELVEERVTLIAQCQSRENEITMANETIQSLQRSHQDMLRGNSDRGYTNSENLNKYTTTHEESRLDQFPALDQSSILTPTSNISSSKKQSPHQSSGRPKAVKCNAQVSSKVTKGRFMEIKQKITGMYNTQSFSFRLYAFTLVVVQVALLAFLSPKPRQD